MRHKHATLEGATERTHVDQLWMLVQQHAAY